MGAKLPIFPANPIPKSLQSGSHYTLGFPDLSAGKAQGLFEEASLLSPAGRTCRPPLAVSLREEALGSWPE